MSEFTSSHEDSRQKRAAEKGRVEIAHSWLQRRNLLGTAYQAPSSSCSSMNQCIVVSWAKLMKPYLLPVAQPPTALLDSPEHHKRQFCTTLAWREGVTQPRNYPKFLSFFWEVLPNIAFLVQNSSHTVINLHLFLSKVSSYPCKRDQSHYISGRPSWTDWHPCGLCFRRSAERKVWKPLLNADQAIHPKKTKQWSNTEPKTQANSQNLATFSNSSGITIKIQLSTFPSSSGPCSGQTGVDQVDPWSVPTTESDHPVAGIEKQALGWDDDHPLLACFGACRCSDQKVFFAIGLLDWFLVFFFPVGRDGCSRFPWSRGFFP